MATSDEVRRGAGDEDPGPRLSVAAVARRLGVAPSTLRTWDRRYGLGPSSHQAGSHRRYGPADLERLVVMRRLTLDGVQPAEAARIVMTWAEARPPRSGSGGWPARSGSGGGPVRSGSGGGRARSGSGGGSGPRAGAPAASSTGAAWGGAAPSPQPPRPVRRPSSPAVPPGAVGLPIAYPPPRGRVAGISPAIGRPAGTTAPIPAITPARPAGPPAPALPRTPAPANGSRGSVETSADLLGTARGATGALLGPAEARRLLAAGLAILPESPDLPAALNLPAELGLPGLLPGLDDVERDDPGETSGGRCGGGRVLALAEGTPQARGLARAAMSLDSPEMWRILSEAITAGGVVQAWNRLALPVLQAIGERWRSTGGVVDVEHLFSETLIDVLRAVVTRHHPQPRPNPLLLACLETEQHTLPLHALAAALAERGTSCRLLGAGLPSPFLVNAVRRTGPSLVFLYARLPVDGASVLAELPRQRPVPRVVLGGPGWGEGWRHDQASTVNSLREAVDAVLALLR